MVSAVSGCWPLRWRCRRCCRRCSRTPWPTVVAPWMYTPGAVAPRWWWRSAIKERGWPRRLRRTSSNDRSAQRKAPAWGWLWRVTWPRPTVVDVGPAWCELVARVGIGLGEEQRKDRRLRLDQLESTTVGLGQVTRQSQPQAGAFRCADRSFEDVRRNRRGHPLSLSADLHHHRGATAPGVYIHGATTVGQGVLEQRRQHLRQRHRSGQHPETALTMDPHASPSLLERRLPLPLEGGNHRVQRDRGGGRLMTLSTPREQLVHHFGETLDLRDRDTCLFPDNREVAGHGDLFQSHEQRGQRRSQLVRGIRGKVTLRGKGAGHLKGAARQDLRDAVDLVDAGNQRL